MTTISSKDVLEVEPRVLQNLKSHAAGPQGKLPLTATKLLTEPSGNLFALSQNAGMGWPTEKLLDPEFLILSTHGGLHAEDGTPIALGFHTGHWEVGLLVGEAAREFRRLRAIPFAAACTDPCDGRSQGTEGMLDSLPYRNDAATVLRRLMRSLPTRRGVMGIATCDKGMPAMMMALASSGDYPAVLVPGGVTLLPERGEDAGKAQTIGARFAQQEISLEYASEIGCRTCATPGGGCQFLGTAASSQVTAEALGLALPATALAPSGHAVWHDSAVRSARALLRLYQLGIGTNRILSDVALRNAMVLHAAFGGSTNMLLHIPAIAHAAGLRRPKVEDWAHINRQVPRLVDAMPNGPRGFATVQVFLAGGVPEVMLKLREAGLLDCSVLTSSGETLGTNLDWWADSEARREMKAQLLARDGIEATDVIMSPAQARSRGLMPTVCFPTGNLAPQGSVIKSTAIDPSLIDESEVYRHTGPARVFITEADAIDAIKRGDLHARDVVVLICGGPLGAGMQETYQVTSALKALQYCKDIAVVTDARFSGVSTGACIGHISPEALAGGPIGKVRDGDMIEIVIDRAQLQGSINFVGQGGERFSAAEGAMRLRNRVSREDLAPHPKLPEDTRIWAALIEASGGVWGGCVYDADAIVQKLIAAPKTPR
jgi:putative YjhG/YagF family dehydratase